MTRARVAETGRSALARVAALAGRWEGPEVLRETGGGVTRATGRMTLTPALSGRVVVEDYEQVGGGAAAFRGHGVFGFDDADGAVTFHWFDSEGALPGDGARGKWWGDALLLEDPGEARVRRTLRVVSPYEIEFVLERGEGTRRLRPVMEGRYRRA